jgi:hypothetical protein
MKKWFNMGNSQSVPDFREQNRLSKPKTNTNGSPGSISNSSKKDLRLSNSKVTLGTVLDGETVTESPTGDRRSKHDSRQLLRSQLCSPDEEEDEVNDDALGELAVNLKDRLSRSASRATQFPSAKSSSTQLNSASSQLSLVVDNEPRAVDLETAVTILQELRKTASPEDLVALRTLLFIFLGRSQILTVN